MIWTVKLRGGPYDGWQGETGETPKDVLIAWECCGLGCEGHATFQHDEPAIVLRTAQAYRRVAVDALQGVAVYLVGESSHGAPEVEERETVGAGSMTSSSHGAPGEHDGRPEQGVSSYPLAPRPSRSARARRDTAGAVTPTLSRPPFQEARCPRF